RDGSASQFAAHVTAFARGQHPPFPDLHDPGTIKFSHEQHLSRDPKALEKWVGGAPGKDLLDRWNTLDCSACHQTGAAGRYMLPVRYEAHCKGCHPLAVQVASDFAGGRARELARNFARPVPAPFCGRESAPALSADAG